MDNGSVQCRSTVWTCLSRQEDTIYKCEGSVTLQQGEEVSESPHACIRVMFDQEYSSPKIAIADCNTSEILADMLVHTDTQFEVCYLFFLAYLGNYG